MVSRPHVGLQRQQEQQQDRHATDDEDDNEAKIVALQAKAGDPEYVNPWTLSLFIKR